MGSNQVSPHPRPQPPVVTPPQWFYLTQPSRSRFAPPPPGSVRPSLGQTLHGIQGDLERMKAEGCPSEKNDTLTKFLGGMHNVEEMMEDVRIAEGFMKTTGDDCSLKSALAQGKSCHRRKELDFISNSQLRAFKLHPNVEGMSLFPSGNKRNQMKKYKKKKREINAPNFKDLELKREEEGGGSEPVAVEVITPPLPVAVDVVKRAVKKRKTEDCEDPDFSPTNRLASSRKKKGRSRPVPGRGRGRPPKNKPKQPTMTKPPAGPPPAMKFTSSLGPGLKLKLKLNQESAPSTSGAGARCQVESLICRIPLNLLPKRRPIE